MPPKDENGRWWPRTAMNSDLGRDPRARFLEDIAASEDFEVPKEEILPCGCLKGFCICDKDEDYEFGPDIGADGEIWQDGNAS